MIAIETVTSIHAPIDRCFDLARSVEVHLAGNVHSGESALAVGGVTSGLLYPSNRVTFRARHFGIWFNLTSQIAAFNPPTHFADAQIRGPFRSMRHDHFFRSLSADETEMRDVFTFAAPLPILGRLAELAVLGRYMRALLLERNAVVKRIAESSDWQKYLA